MRVLETPRTEGDAASLIECRWLFTVYSPFLLTTLKLFEIHQNTILISQFMTKDIVPACTRQLRA